MAGAMDEGLCRFIEATQIETEIYWAALSRGHPSNYPPDLPILRQHWFFVAEVKSRKTSFE